MQHFNTSDQRKPECNKSHIPYQPGHYYDIALSREHYNDIGQESFLSTDSAKALRESTVYF